ncbi:MAG: DUF6231 family protein [Gammaproteobacteria bacterium]
MNALIDLIQAEKPKNLFIVSSGPLSKFVSLLEQLKIHEIHIKPSIVTKQSNVDYFDLMIIFPEIDCNKDQLGFAKNILTKSIILFRKNKCIKKEYFELGFIMADNIEIGSSIDCYTYNLKNYNYKRPWNSAKDWANPENFDKFRW